MFYSCRKRIVLAARAATIIGVLMLATSFIGCSKAPNSTAEKPVQRTFATPDDAGAAFLQAAQSDDHAALQAIFGPETDSVLLSGDPVRDQDGLKDFAAAYNQMHRWREIKVGGQLLYVGADNYPFPIPLGQNSSSQWVFDTAAGKDEILARRIGKGELTALAACSALADAERKYFSQTHDGDTVKQYAQRITSDPGKQNGLYWEATEGQPSSPLGQVGDFAKAAGYVGTGAKPQPFEGYYYQILTKQGDKAKGGAKDYISNGKMTGGFAFLAYPAQYRNSGIMTFIVGGDGIVYQKDLGDHTSDAAAIVTEYNPSDGWKPAL